MDLKDSDMGPKNIVIWDMDISLIQQRHTILPFLKIDMQQQDPMSRASTGRIFQLS